MKDRVGGEGRGVDLRALAGCRWPGVRVALQQLFAHAMAGNRPKTPRSNFLLAGKEPLTE